MAIPSWLKKEKDSVLYNGDGYFAFFIPERYFDGKNSAKAIIMKKQNKLEENEIRDYLYKKGYMSESVNIAFDDINI